MLHSIHGNYFWIKQLVSKRKSMKPLPASKLRATIPKSWLKLVKKTGHPFHGQDRALAAMEFAAKAKFQGFNLYVMGQSGYGRHQAVVDVLRKEAATEPSPVDWIYVYNFQRPDSPKAIQLPAGKAHALRKAMENLVDELANDIPAIFESDEYQNKRQLIEDELARKHEKQLNELMESTRQKGLVLLRTPMGFAIVASKNGKTISSEEFSKLPEGEQKKINERISEQQVHLETFIKQIPKREKEHRNRVENLNAEMAQDGVDDAIEIIVSEFGNIKDIKSYLEDVRKDLIENADLFLVGNQTAQAGAFPVATTKHYEAPQFQRYLVNVLVGALDGEKEGAAIVTAKLPTFSNLIGRIEHVQEMGALVTNFTMIKAGELHKANGGYLIIDARQLLMEPYAWDALKRALMSREVRISTVGERLGLMAASSLAPDPIPLDVRVILVGDRFLYYLLCAYDPDFPSLFKIAADFEDEIELTRENARELAANLLSISENQNLRPLDGSGVKRVLIEATRIADDRERFSLNQEKLSDLVIEADYWAGKADKKQIGQEDIDKAVSEIENRSDRIKQLSHDAIDRDIKLIDTEGEVVGQINGLSVMMLGNLRFGQPSRITVQTRMGKGRVIDIEREVELGGPIHSKGVLILSSYLAANYAQDVPLSLWASIVFEQSYGGVDGDSASAAELIAVLSSLAGLPINQSYAITGSVNQLGEIQAIGGVNEKIEGFFDVCDARGLTGLQGVIIPKINVKNLALRQRVIDAVATGKFHIYPAETIDDAAQFLMQTSFGNRRKNGQYPDNTINGLVEQKLRSFAQRLKQFAKSNPKEEGDG